MSPWALCLRAPQEDRFRIRILMTDMMGHFRKMKWQRRTKQWLCAVAPVALCLASVVVAIVTSVSFAQQTLPTLPATALLPEPIYWKQNLFLIPYQWSSAADTGAAQSVLLLVSKDQGATWQKISEAKPQVKAFNYHAEGDGEYWFAIRTVDRVGRLWPEGPYRPELRVIVDTTMPRIDTLTGAVRENGTLELDWRANDTNIDANSWKIEVQNEAGVWQALPLASMNLAALPTTTPGINAGHGSVSLPLGSRPTTVRATVLDRAGNSAAFQSVLNSNPNTVSGAAAPVVMNPLAAGPTQSPAVPTTPAMPVQWPTIGNASNVPPNVATGDPFQSRSPLPQPVTSTYPTPNANASAATGVPQVSPNQPSEPTQAPPAAPPPVSGWMSPSAAATQSAPAQTQQATTQAWPAATTARTPFRLSGQNDSLPNDGVTTYGNPSGLDGQVTAAPTSTINSGTEVTDRFAQLPTTHQLPNAPQLAPPATEPTTDIRPLDMPASPSSGPNFQPLEPFRQASMTRLPATDASLTTPADVSASIEPPLRRGPAVEQPPIANPSSQVKLVGSRTFELEYVLDDVGRWGVSRIELWGTRDGGRTWRSYGQDDDHRSPFRVTVDEEGTYGFRIVVESAGGPAALPPQPGDAPELWIAIDLKRPVVELTSIQPGTGNLSDHLILRWRATDENLEARPISLFYSSRTTGPWSAIATSLENNGEYAWRIERHVPPRCYLRLEARDAAGNLAAYQTLQPVEIAAQQPTGHIRAVEPIGPTAAKAEPAVR